MGTVVFSIPPFATSTWADANLYNGDVFPADPALYTTYPPGKLSTESKWNLRKPAPTLYHADNGSLLAKIQWDITSVMKAQVSLFGGPEKPASEILKLMPKQSSKDDGKMWASSPRIREQAES